MITMGRRYAVDESVAPNFMIRPAEEFDHRVDEFTFTEAKRDVLRRLQSQINYLRSIQAEIRRLRVADVD